MSRNLTVLLSVLILTVGLNLPTAFSTVQPELTKKEKKQVKRLAKKQAKKLDKKQHPVDTDGLEDNAVTIAKLDSSVIPGGTLPAGVTLRGVFSPTVLTNAVGSVINSHGVTFGGYRLPSRPIAHIIGTSDLSTPECPGTKTTPEAAPGHVCLYLTATNANAVGISVLDPETGGTVVEYDVDTKMTNTIGDGSVSTLGFSISVQRTPSNVASAVGVWAVRS